MLSLRGKAGAGQASAAGEIGHKLAVMKMAWCFRLLGFEEGPVMRVNNAIAK